MYLKQLIADSFGREAADAWAAFSPSTETIEAISKAGRNLLTHFPTIPGACAMMSALYACQLEKLKTGPAYVVAGSLYVIGPRFVGDTRVFGEPAKLDGRTRFSSSDLSWDGHAWIVCGDRLVDVSVFRTAYSPFSPPALAAHVRKAFGEGRGMMICPLRDVVTTGLRYEPEYVLSQEQVDAVARGAIAKVESL